MNIRRQLPVRSSACLAFAACCALTAAAPTSSGTGADHSKTKKAVDRPTLFVVGYSHLDTQWCWTYPQVIREFIPSTLHENFALFEKYPRYVFNWTGSNRYRLIQEYYPEDYARLKKYVAAGQWFPGGSSVEEGDVNSPSEESLIRQVLYGNEFFRREFGVQSEEYTLPDCFGFPASLPSILAHCGLDGFSTQKLTWGSAVGIPFNVGAWIGPDGRSVVAALNATPYDGHIIGSRADPHDLKTNPTWIRRMQEAQAMGVPVDFRYYGVGDRGGSVEEQDLKNLLLSEDSKGPFDIYAGRMDKLFTSLSEDQKAKLPTYTGDLELTNHSAGSLSSEATQKKWNRENEVLADDTERASVVADWLGALPYDRDRITDAWLRFLPGQFHDLMAGTALPLAYTYTWNDQVLAMNEFSGVLRTAVGAASRELDTRGKGLPIVVYNPLSIARTDVVEATLDNAAGYPNPRISIVGPSGVVPSQVVSSESGKSKVLFLANTPPVGFEVYHAMMDAADRIVTTSPSALKVTPRSIENARYIVRVNEAGDVASVIDKMAHKELLSGPARLEYQHENPAQYPAWNMDWSDQNKPPADFVSGTPEFKIVENGPARVGLQIARHHNGSTFVQTIRLAAGDAGNRIEFATKIDWQGKESALKADFPLTVSNPDATYNWDLGTVKRGNNDPKKFEVPSHRWFDLTATDKSYGVSVLNEAKFGSDKPSDNDLRLTLLYTPGTRGGYQHQGRQDWGHHEFTYALVGHVGTWQAGKTQWQSARLSQPLVAFQSPAHFGLLGKSFSFAQVNNPNVSIEALKKAEDTNEYVVRINELSGSAQTGVKVGFASPILAAREIDGQERTIGQAQVVDGKLMFDTTGYRPRAFAVRLAGPGQGVIPVQSTPLALPYNLDAISSWASKTDGNFDGQGKSLPGELMPSTIVSDGITFRLGPKKDGAKNAVIPNGQTLKLPAGKARNLYVLAASASGDTPATFRFGSTRETFNVQTWDGYVGQWDTRLWEGPMPELAYDWHNAYAGLIPGFIKRATVAWYSDHRRLADGTNDIYAFAYLYRYAIPVPDGARSVVLPKNAKVRILAATVATDPNDAVRPLEPLYENTGTAQPQAPGVSPAGGSFSDSTVVTVSRPLYWSQSEPIRYTTDGSKPTSSSPFFIGSLRLSHPTVLKVAQFGRFGESSPVATVRLDVRDVTPPSVRSVIATPFEPTVRITFSEPLDRASAESASSYSLSSGTVVQSAKLSSDGDVVVLTLNSQVASGSGTIAVKGVKDLVGNTTDTTAPVTLLKPVFEQSSEQTFNGKTNGPSHSGVEGLPVDGSHAWTINMFVWVDQVPAELTPIAGFGDGRDSQGAERFLIKFRNSISFWGSNVDVRGKESLDVGRWQMISATYDGQMLRLFKDGREIGAETISLSDAQNLVRFAPRPAWENGARFAGKIRGFTIWDQALSSEALKGLGAGDQGPGST